MSEQYLHGVNYEAAFVPVDMQTAANNGDWINLALYEVCHCVLFKAIGTAGQDPIFTLKQAKTAAGGTPIDLNFRVIYEKVGATLLTGQAKFTRKTQTAAATYTNTDSAEGEAIMVVEVRASELDVANGYQYIQLSIPDVGGNAQLGCGLYVLFAPRFRQQILDDAKV